MPASFQIKTDHKITQRIKRRADHTTAGTCDKNGRWANPLRTNT